MSLGSLESSKSNGPPAIAFEGTAKAYGRAEVVGPVTLTVQPGEMVAMVGPSGAGKTTLLLMAAGSLQPTAGRIRLHGHDLAGLRPGRELSRLVGMVPQQFDLVPNLSALNNVLAGRLGEWSLFGSLASLMWPRDGHIALHALERVGIADLARIRGQRLSGGEQQRVAIARLLVQDPAVVLADEPVASLDPARAEEVVRLLVDVTREAEKTLVASIHSVELARNHFTRVVGLRNGLVHFDVASHAVTEAMLREVYDLQGLRSAP